MFYQKQEKRTLCLNAGVILQPEECVKVLGINVESRVNFNQHISYLRKKNKKSARCILSLMSTCLDYTAKICFLGLFIKCYFDNCPVVWHFCNISDIRKLKKCSIGP